MRETIKNIRPLYILYSILRNWRIRLMTWKPTYSGIGLITDHVPSFMESERFNSAFLRALYHQHYFSIPDSWKNHVTCWAAEQGTKLEGDFVECGVAKGFTSKVILEYLGYSSARMCEKSKVWPWSCPDDGCLCHIDNQISDEPKNKNFYLIDTYNGADPKLFTENDKNRHFDYPEMYEFVKEKFKRFPNVKVVKGSIPEVLSDLPIEKVAYIHIDMNYMIPEIAATNFFWPKMSKGAVMVLDDYGHQGFDEQRLAFDKFAEEKGVPILCLPTGQAIMVKN